MDSITENPNNPLALTPEEQALLTKPIKSERPISRERGASSISKIEFEDGSAAIFKPGSGEKAPPGFSEYKPGQAYKGERASYLVSRFLGFDLVPTTVIRRISNFGGQRLGSLQEFIPDAIPSFQVPDQQKYQDQLYKLWIFDFFTWNADRRPPHILIKDDQVFAIDNGLSFLEFRQYADRPFFNVEAPADLIENLVNFEADREKQAALRTQLGELIPKDQLEACFARIQNLTEILKTEGKITQRVDY